ncbi:hypothetical protein ACSFBX_28985 [Variovorax sp. RB2P76]|uniref:hypothetical protein n=1 Tax=Variovorax sp. RB2P76 TaxID=3443736 RepID=UPI003F48A2C3
MRFSRLAQQMLGARPILGDCSLAHRLCKGPDDEEALLAEAGFSQARLFYASLAFRGWVAYA